MDALAAGPRPGRRRAIELPALVVGHPRDPIHPAADAAMLAEELRNSRFVAATGIREWRYHPETERRGDRLLRVLLGGGGENAGVSLYRDEGVVLRTQKLGEADRIVTLLTREHGLVRAVAKGVRRTTSRFGARLEPFSHVDCLFAEGRSLDIITQVEVMGLPGRAISSDYSAYTSGTVMLETAERLTGEEGHPSVQQYLLLVAALRALGAGDREPGSILDSFLLRSLAVSGYAPSFEECARCGLPGPHRAFTPAAGGMLCTTCRVPGSAHPAPETVELLGALLSGDWDLVRAAEPRHAREASGLVAAYLAWHLERSLRSMTHVER